MEGAKFCTYCLSIYTATSASPRKKYKYCPMCGRELDFDRWEREKIRRMREAQDD